MCSLVTLSNSIFHEIEYAKYLDDSLIFLPYMTNKVLRSLTPSNSFRILYFALDVAHNACKYGPIGVMFVFFVSPCFHLQA